MFDFDVVEAQSARKPCSRCIGLDGRAIRTILEEPAPFDPRGDAEEVE